MKIGVLGTGSVGTAIAAALVAKGHNVVLGSRTAGSEKAKQWLTSVSGNAAEGTFADAAAHGEMVFLCLNGAYALEVIRGIDAQSLSGKIVVDVTNPLDFSKGMPPAILEDYHIRSLGEQIQAAVPEALVVKALNTINYKVMVDPRIVGGGDHHIFLCGNSEEAKKGVQEFLVQNFHWNAESLVDLGDIRVARTTEAIVPFWVMVMQEMKTPVFNFRVVQ
jgi:predicted dinucleotide-binding enzyme